MNKEERQNRPTTKELLEEYYRGVEKKGGWGHLLSEDFLLSGTIAQETRGRDAYVNNSFFKLIRGLKVKELIEDGDTGFALVSYDLVSLEGERCGTRLRSNLLRHSWLQQGHGLTASGSGWKSEVSVHTT